MTNSNDDDTNDGASQIAAKQLGGLLGSAAKPKRAERSDYTKSYEPTLSKRVKPDMRDEIGDDVKQMQTMFKKPSGAGSTRINEAFNEDITHVGSGENKRRTNVRITNNVLLESAMQIVQPKRIDEYVVYEGHHLRAVADSIWGVALDAFSKQGIVLAPDQMAACREAALGLYKMMMVNATYIDDEGEALEVYFGKPT